MLPSQIEVYFKDEKGLMELLKLCEEKFKVIDSYAQQFEQNLMSTCGEYSTAKEQIAGIKMFLNDIYSEAITWKKNKEQAKYMELKIAIENKPPVDDGKGKLTKEKFSSAPTEIEASVSVATWRRVRNILEGKINSCWDSLKICEQRIIEIKGENNLNNGKNN
jgi:hypothetical protein